MTDFEILTDVDADVIATVEAFEASWAAWEGWLVVDTASDDGVSL